MELSFPAGTDLPYRHQNINIYSPASRAGRQYENADFMILRQLNFLFFTLLDIKHGKK